MKKSLVVFLHIGIIILAACQKISTVEMNHILIDSLIRKYSRQNTGKTIKYTNVPFLITGENSSHFFSGKLLEIQKKHTNEKPDTEKVRLEIKDKKGKVFSLYISFLIILLLSIDIYLHIRHYFKKKKLHQSLLQQKNELWFLKQKIKDLSQQIKSSQYKINQLEQEKKQIVSELHIVIKEKKTILQKKEEELVFYREQESEMLFQKNKYEDLCFTEFKKLFCASPLSHKIPAFGIDKILVESLNLHSQKQLIKLMDEICCNFATRLSVQLQNSIEKTCLCCLIRLQVKPRYIIILCNLSKEAYYKQCQRIAETLTGKTNGSALKDYLNTF